MSRHQAAEKPKYPSGERRRERFIDGIFHADRIIPEMVEQIKISKHAIKNKRVERAAHSFVKAALANLEPDADSVTVYFARQPHHGIYLSVFLNKAGVLAGLEFRHHEGAQNLVFDSQATKEKSSVPTEFGYSNTLKPYWSDEFFAITFTAAEVLTARLDSSNVSQLHPAPAAIEGLDQAA